MEYGAGDRRGQPWSGDSVRALRRHLGLSQQQLSEELGTRQQTISEWETGMYLPRGASRTLLNIIAERAGFEYGVHEPEDAGGTAEGTNEERPG